MNYAAGHRKEVVFFHSMFQTLVIYALGVVLQDSDTWSTPYRSHLLTYVHHNSPTHYRKSVYN